MRRRVHAAACDGLPALSVVRLLSGALVGLLCLAGPVRGGGAGALRFRSSILDSDTRDVEVSGDFAWSLFTSGLVGIDISDPAEPMAVGRVFFAEAPEDLRLRDGLAIVAVGAGGFRVVDISEPAQPWIVSAVETDGFSEGLDVVGDTLYVADGPAGLCIFSLADPALPGILGSLPGANPAEAVDVVAGHAYVAALQEGLIVVDVANPASPVEVARVPLVHTAADVRAAPPHVYVADTAGLATLRIDDPESPSLASYQFTVGRALDLYLASPLLHLAADLEGFHLFDIGADPDLPVWRSNTRTGEDARGIAAEGDLCAVADDFAGILFYDTTDPAAPESLGVYRSQGESRGGVIDGDIAFIAQGAMGLVTADLSDIARPDTLGRWTEGVSFVYGADVEGTLLAVANGLRGIALLDVVDPASPRELGEVGTGRDVTAVDLAGSRVYAVDGDLHAIDVSAPATPEIVSTFDAPVAAVDVAVSGERAFVAFREGGVTSFDLASPGDTLHPLDTLDARRFALGVAVRGDLLFVADAESGLVVARFDAGGRMTELGRLPTDRPVLDVSASEDVVVLALGGGEVMAVDVGDPAAPVPIDRFPTPGASDAVHVEGARILVGDRSSTIFLELEPPAGVGAKAAPARPPRSPVALLPNRPNPFNPSTTIPFRVAGPAGIVDLTLFTVRGRRVRTLFHGLASAGEHEVAWDGRSAEGEPLPSGVYVYVLTIGEFRSARKMLLLR